MHRIVQTTAVRRLHRCLAPFAHIETVRFFSKRHMATPTNLKTTEFIECVIPSLHEINLYAHELCQKFHLDRHSISDRFNRGNRVLLALKGQRVVAMLWMAFDFQPVSEVGAVLQLRRNEFVTFHAVTLPEWRNLGLSTLLNERAYLYAVERQRPIQLAWRSTRNHSALSVARKLGQTPVSEVTAFWLCSHRIWARHQHGADAPILLMNSTQPPANPPTEHDSPR